MFGVKKGRNKFLLIIHVLQELVFRCSFNFQQLSSLWCGHYKTVNKHSYIRLCSQRYMFGIILIMQHYLILECETFQHYALTHKCNAGPHEKEMPLLKVKTKHRTINKPTETKVLFSLSQKICLFAWTEVVSD